LAVVNKIYNRQTNSHRSQWLLNLLFVILLIISSRYVIGGPKDSLQQDSLKHIKITAYPAVGYSPETSLSFGVVGFLVVNPRNQVKNAEYHRPSSISPYFLYTLNNQFLSAIDFEFYPGSKINVNTTIRLFNYPDFYYGIGNETPDIYETYTDKFFKWNWDVSYVIYPNLFIGLAFNWQINQISDLDPDGRLVQNNINGIEGGSILGIGPLLRYDSRNNIFYPDKGIFFEFKSLFYPNAFGNDYQYQNFSIDFRSFHHVFSKKNILAFQVYYDHVNGRSIPFYKLPRLGGDSRLRGINNENRYRDNHAYYLQVEGRRELFWRLGGVIFAGVGNVNNRLSDFEFNSLKYVFGIGGRFRPFKNEKLNLRLDIGKGPGDQYAIYLAVKEAF